MSKEKELLKHMALGLNYRIHEREHQQAIRWALAKIEELECKNTVFEKHDEICDAINSLICASTMETPGAANYLREQGIDELLEIGIDYNAFVEERT